jgi:hypothetical protein
MGRLLVKLAENILVFFLVIGVMIGEKLAYWEQQQRRKE